MYTYISKSSGLPNVGDEIIDIYKRIKCYLKVVRIVERDDKGTLCQVEEKRFSRLVRKGEKR